MAMRWNIGSENSTSREAITVSNTGAHNRLTAYCAEVGPSTVSVRFSNTHPPCHPIAQDRFPPVSGEDIFNYSRDSWKFGNG